MKFTLVQQALAITSGQVTIDPGALNDTAFTTSISNPFFNGHPIIITSVQPVQSDGKTRITILGKASCSFLHLDDPNSLPDMQAAFELKNIDVNGEGTLMVTLKYFLPKAWRFQSSFPTLPVVFDLTTGLDGEQRSILDHFIFMEADDHRNLDACFVMTTDSTLDVRYKVTLESGLNFVGRWDATGMLGVLENLLPSISKQLTLFGPVIFPSIAKPDALTADKFVWDVQPSVPGIHLQASLGIKPSFGKTIQFQEVACRLYSPITTEWLTENATYQPAMAYLCEINVPSPYNLKATLLAKNQLGEDTLLAAAQFQKANLTNFLTLLTEVAHGDFTAALPSEVSDYLNKSGLADLELQSVAAMLAPRDSSFGVAYTYFTFGMPHLNWVIFKDILEIDSLWIEIIVFNPFETDESRTISGTIIGMAELLGLKMQVIVELPDLFISAEQIEAKTVPLKDLFRKFLPDLPAPADLSIDRLTVIAKPSIYYTFSMSIAGDPPWTIQLGQKATQTLVIQDIEFSLSKDVGITGSVAAVLKFEKLAAPAVLNGENQDVQLFISASIPISSQTGWQFEGSTGPGQEIPIGHLVTWLGEKFDATPPPSAVEKLTIENLRISFNTQSKDFTFTIETKFPVDSQELEMVLTIEVKRQQDNTYSKHFSAKITVAKMEFDVIFDNKQGTTAFIAAFNNPQGQPIKIQELLSKVSSNLDVPDSLEFKIKDALLAYQSKQPTSVNTTGKNYLFGLDIDGGLNLSDLKLPDLPLVGSLFPPDQTLKLSFQLLASKEDFTVEEITALGVLLPTGPKLPNKAINARLDLSTVLQIGQESKSIELQIGVNTKSDAQNTGLVPAAAKKELTATAGSSDTKAIVASSAPSAANVQGADGLQWIAIQKTFGPVQFERIGLAYKDGNITGALDAALIAGPLTIALSGLSVTSPLTKFDPVFDLHGLGIDYRNGPLEIGGAFLKQTITPTQGKPYTVFAGLAVIRTEKLSISAIGSYASIKDAQNNDHASMFIYAVLDYPIGGPAFFYITGLAAGFGYNRALNMPTIETLAAFPLVEEATRAGGPPQLPASQKAQQDTITTELTKLETYIPPAIGENFLAIGIKFTSFKIIDSFALLVVKFGNRLEFDLLGLSKLQSPPPEAGGPAVAKATLALKATFIPDEGSLSVQAQLTSDSYILDQACHLTGGFAFFSWFKDTVGPDGNNISAGDFVLTLGGYHPDYVLPAHYPRVPRLGINWQVNDQLSIKGDGYFALTPHALMAGGHLEALWHSSDNSLRAWFKAGADFLISWQPYHYDAHIYVDIGASYTFDFFGSHTISVDLGADLHIWGPDFSGTATIHYYLFSLSVDFGSGSAQKLEPISWDSFKKSFLPADQKRANQYQVCSIAVQDGLVRQIEENGSQRWIVNPKDFVLMTNSAVPVKSASKILGKEDAQTKKRPKKDIPLGGGSQPFAIAPMGLAANKISSEHMITIKRGDDFLSDEFVYLPIHKAAPAALWGEPEMDGNFLKPPQVNPSSAMVPDTLAGFEIRPASKFAATGDPVDMQAAKYDTQPAKSGYQFAPEKDLLASYAHGQQAWSQADTDLARPEIRKIQQDFIEALRFPATTLDYGESLKQDLMMR